MRAGSVMRAAASAVGQGQWARSAGSWAALAMACWAVAVFSFKVRMTISTVTGASEVCQTS